MAQSRKKTKTVARKKAAPRRTKVVRARPKASGRKAGRSVGNPIQGLLTMLGFTKAKGNQTQNIGVTVGAVVAAALVGYGIYQIRTPHTGTNNSSGMTASNASMDGEFAAMSGKTRSERIAFWSYKLLDEHKATRQLNRLVASTKIEDNAPLVPKDFDCTTYVETVAALSQSDRASEFPGKLLAIRYRDGESTYSHRNHFPEVDWIPNNTHAGILTDVTAQIAKASGVDMKTESKEIQRHVWLEQQAKSNHVSRAIASATEKEWSATAKAEVNYVEITNLKQMLGHIPSGTVINLVHHNDAQKPVLISHQGIVVREDGNVYLRHASSGGDVKNVLLTAYLEKLTKSREKKTSWPLVGFNFNQIN